MTSEEQSRLRVLQGTLDLMILRTLHTMGPQHAYAIATRLEQISEESLKLNQGTLYPALVRLEQEGWIKGAWGKTESNREAKFYSLTRSGRKALERETARWRQMAGLVEKVLGESAG
jgi:PadR family transcriptional regulator, regulatory protein PadR